MNNKQKNFSLTIIIISLLFLATSLLSWLLLGQAGNLSSASLSPAIIIMLQVVLVLAVIVVVILLVNQFRAPFKTKAANIALQNIIEEATQDTEFTRRSIIRLKQILEPEQVGLAASIAALLEKLLESIDDIQNVQLSTQEQHLSVSKQASDLKVKHDLLIQAPNSRSEFLSRMGDEITMPMKSLYSMLGLLKNMELDNQARDLLIIATHSAHSLIENLSNILAFSKLDANLLTLHKQPFELKSTISAVIETQESIALSKGLIVETHINPDVGELIDGDKKLIIKILDNLISNAIRFTSHGQVQVIIDTSQADSVKLLRFTIIDTGIGIPDSALSGLFDSLETDTALVNSSFTGRLRLIVCKQLCELMGGEIGVRSKVGKGTQIWFTVDISS